jgi:hypothetical protein
MTESFSPMLTPAFNFIRISSNRWPEKGMNVPYSEVVPVLAGIFASVKFYNK